MYRNSLLASATAGDSDAKVMTADYRLNIGDDDGIKLEAAFPGDDDIEFHELIANADGIDDICTLLHSESMAGNAERVRHIIRTYADKNILVKLGSNKETALHLAADCGNTEVVEILIDAARSLPSSSVNDDPDNQITCFEDFIRHPNDSMNTALHLAVSNDHMAIAKRLVEANPNDRHVQNSKGETPIYLAAKLGYEEMVQMMCEACTAPSLAGPDGTTALHAAIMMLTEGKNEGLAVVTALINAAKTSASSANSSRNSVRSFLRQSNKEDKDTALHLAVRRNHLEVVELILRADPSLLIKNDKHIQNSKGETPIYLAAKLGYEEMVQMMCKACRVPSLAGPDGTTALHAAIMMLTEGKDEGLAVVKALIDAARISSSSANRSYSSVKSFLRQSNKDKDTALHLAVRRNHLRVATHILEVDPSMLIINKQSDFRSTIYEAAEQGYMDMVDLLCDRYEAQNNLVHRGQTALIAAIKGRHIESVINKLENAKHLVTCDDHTGWTLLHYAAYYKFDSVLKIIVEAQASREVVYKEKIPTPLSVAVKEGHISTAIRLMKLSPDLCIVVNHEGQNILHMAAVQNNKNMVLGILKHCPQEYAEKILNGKDVDGNTPLHLLISQGCFIPELMYSYKWLVDMPGRENKNWTLTDMFHYKRMLFNTSPINVFFSIKEWPVDTMTRNNKNWTPADMLYFQEQITGDQVQMKIAVDFMQAFTERGRYNEESKTRESLVPLGKRSRKDAEFEKVKEKLMKKEVERSRQKANTDIVITALITTIAFTVGFTMPGGLHGSGEPDQGLAVLSKKTAFKVFMVSDVLALVLSANSLCLYFWESVSEKTQFLRRLTTVLNVYSVAAMMVTFISGTYVVLSPDLAITVAIIGSYTFVYQMSLPLVNNFFGGC